MYQVSSSDRSCMRSVSVPWVADVAAGNLGSLSPPVHVIGDLPVKHQTTTPEHVILGQRELTRGRDATVMRGFLAAIPTTPTKYRTSNPHGLGAKARPASYYVQ